MVWLVVVLLWSLDFALRVRWMLEMEGMIQRKGDAVLWKAEDSAVDYYASVPPVGFIMSITTSTRLGQVAPPLRFCFCLVSFWKVIKSHVSQRVPLSNHDDLGSEG
jgi:hypothetical protein